jgi:hypothetical protein
MAISVFFTSIVTSDLQKPWNIQYEILKYNKRGFHFTGTSE